MKPNGGSQNVTGGHHHHHFNHHHHKASHHHHHHHHVPTKLLFKSQSIQQMHQEAFSSQMPISNAGGSTTASTQQ